MQTPTESEGVSSVDIQVKFEAATKFFARLQYFVVQWSREAGKADSMHSALHAVSWRIKLAGGVMFVGWGSPLFALDRRRKNMFLVSKCMTNFVKVLPHVPPIPALIASKSCEPIKVLCRASSIEKSI